MAARKRPAQTEKTKKEKVQYVDGKKFYEAMCQYENQCKAAKERGESLPTPSNYIGKCFLDIARRFGMQLCYARYPFLEDMISDAVVAMCSYCHNFDQTLTKSAFAYFSTAAYHSFINRIAKEKRQIALVDRLIDVSPYTVFFDGTVDMTGLDDAMYDQIRGGIETRKNRDDDNYEYGNNGDCLSYYDDKYMETIEE